MCTTQRNLVWFVYFIIQYKLEFGITKYNFILTFNYMYGNNYMYVHIHVYPLY